MWESACFFSKICVLNYRFLKGSPNLPSNENSNPKKLFCSQDPGKMEQLKVVAVENGISVS